MFTRSTELPFQSDIKPSNDGYAFHRLGLYLQGEKMRQCLGFILYFICIAQILMFVSVDIKAQEQKRIIYSDVLKTLEEHTCLECHSTNKKEGNVDLSNYEGIVKVLKPGHANQSLLVHAVEIKMILLKPWSYLK